MLAKLEKLISDFKGEEGALIPILQRIQKEYGHVSHQAVKIVSKIMGYSESHIYGVLTFYSQFYLHPRGKHIIKACCGTACHVKGSQNICDKIENTLEIKEGETSLDHLFTFEKIACMGSCGLAPLVMIGQEIIGNTSAFQIEKKLQHLKKEEEIIKQQCNKCES
ncbi:MAG: NADH-quinone oxidoreductase subunit NuoE [Candidatus Firestonebacteria bacterium]|nr:NADH-quinone oxidoreductase subunit NuoE [Candidatus Firestonebacteria bacterium]